MGRNVPFVNMVDQHRAIKDQLLQAVARVIDSGMFIGGEDIELFETDFSKLSGSRFAVAVNSGTDALILALQVLGVGPGDEVITAPNSFVGSAACAVRLGARPVFADVRDDLTIDPTRIEQAITARTKVIMPVHLTGRACDMAPILDIAQRHEIHVVEDCAQAITAAYRGQVVGSFGILGCFSLHPLKTLGALGDGGVVTTDDPMLAARLRQLRNHGLIDRDTCIEFGANSRLDTVQAAMLLAKLPYIDAWIERRRLNAAAYRELLSGLSEVVVPTEEPWEHPVYHTFTIQAERRDELQRFLEVHGVGAKVHYAIPIHLQPAAAALGYGPGSFPVAEHQATRILSLPIYPELTADDLEYVARTVERFYRQQT